MTTAPKEPHDATSAPTKLEVLFGETFRAMRHWVFRRYWIGAFFSFVGGWFQQVAHGWLIYDLTESKWLLGLVGFASGIPMLLSPIGGAIVDRLDRRTVLMSTQSVLAVSATTLGLLTITGNIEYWHILTLAFTNGCLMALDAPARLSLVSELVPKEDLANGIALNATAFHSARIVGPALGGILLQQFGAGWCFLANGMSYLAILAALSTIPLPKRLPKTNGGTVMQDLSEGLNFVRARPELSSLILHISLLGMFGFSYMTLMPVMAADELKVSERGLGELFSSIGIGSLFGLLLMARLARAGLQTNMVVIAANLFGLLVIGFSQVDSPLIAKVLLAFVGLTAVTQMANTNTILQLAAPDRLRGRVVSLHVWALNGPAPFGAVMIGAFAEEYGARAAIALGGAIMAISGLRLAVMHRKLSRVSDTESA